MSESVEIGYVSETPQEYSEALRKVKTLRELSDIVQFYRPLTDDAIRKVKSMSQSDFDKFIVDIKKSNRAQGMTAKRIADEWGDILMPRTMLEISMIAINAGAPFGTAFIRMKEAGRI